MRARNRNTRAAASIVASFILVASLAAVPVAGARPSAQNHAVTPETPFNVELLHEFEGGTYTSVEASGGAWYAIRAGRLVVGNAVVPMADPVATDIRGTAVHPYRDGVLVLRDEGFAWVDCSDPATPVLLGEFEYGNDVELKGFFAGPRYAYCVFEYRWGGRVCKVFDLSDLVNTGYDAVVALDFDDLSGDVRGAYAYVKTATGFKVVSLASPLSPTVVHTYGGVALTADLTVSDSHLYLAHGDPAAPTAAKGLRVFSLASPSAPALVRDLAGAGPVADVSVEGTRAWTLDASQTVRLYDVTTPSSPVTRTGSAVVATHGVNIAADGANLFVRSYDAEAGTSRISGIDGTDPSAFTVVSWREADGGHRGAWIDGDVAYLTVAGGIAAYGISDPGTPTPLPWLALGYSPRDVRVDGTTGYACYGKDGFSTVQRLTGMPAAPVAEAAWTTDTAVVSAIDVDGGTIAAASDSGLLLFDVSGAPVTLAGAWPSADPASDVLLDGTRAWLAADDAASGWSTVYEFDVTTPAAPALLGEHGIPGDAPTLAKCGDALYVGWTTGSSSAVKIFDVASPGAMGYLTSYDTGWSGCADTGASDGATPTAVAAGPGGLRLIDASSPRIPFLAGYHPLGGERVMMSGDLVLATGPDDGARLYRYEQVTDRDAGATRYETAVEISKEITSSTWVVLATGANYPDALCGAPLAYAVGAPILLVQPDNIPDDVATRITELGATKAYILGGTGAVGAGVIANLAALGISGPNVTRLSGADRYGTAEEIALELELVRGESSCATAFVATGLSYPDALAASGAAAKMGAPILLVRPTAVPAPTAAALTALGCADTVVLGGTGAVSAYVSGLLPSPERLEGATRYDTAAAIAAFSLRPECGFSADELFVVTGLNFPDALPCGVISAMHDAPTLLVSTTVPSATGGYVTAHAADIDTMRIVGGTGAIPADVEWDLFELVR